MTRIAILDDYQRVALGMADWSAVAARAGITVFDRPIGADEAAEILAPFDIVCHVRERMPFPKALIDRLPNLKLICITGPAHRTLDLDAASARGIPVSNTGGAPEAAHATPELTLGLMLALVRHIAHEDRRMRDGLWQGTMGSVLYGRTLGIVGLGRVGGLVAKLAGAFGMKLLAWSQNLTDERAVEAGATHVAKDDLFAASDIVTIHLVLSERTRGLVGAREIGLMKPRAYLVNTSRGPVVDEAALIAALTAKTIAGAALDVYDIEPLPAGHALRRLDNVVLTPHLGYVSEEGYRAYYAGTVANILAFLDGKPARVINPEALRR